MSIKSRIRRWLGIESAPAPAAAPPPRRPMKINSNVIAMLSSKKDVAGEVHPEHALKYELPKLHPAVFGEQYSPDTLAMDDAGVSFLQELMRYGAPMQGYLTFPGYPHLAYLSLRSEYRSPSETIATEMTRKWIKFSAKRGTKEKGDRLTELEQAMDKFGVRDHFRRCKQIDGIFGRSHLYIKIKGQTSDEGRKLPLKVNKESIGKGDLEGFVPIEPIWTSPLGYNAIDPTAENFFKPDRWLVMAKETHASRMLMFVTSEVPDMLKPAYNFGGISMTQLMEEYVNHWLRTRDSVSEMLHSFSLNGLAIDMANTLAGSEDGDEIVKRAELFNATRDNKGLMLTNKDTEEFFQFNVPLSGLDSLKAQSQENMAAPSHIPLVKLLGVTPTGLNANSSGEMQCFYDFVRASQLSVFQKPLTTVIHCVMLHLWGEVDEDIVYDFVTLEEPSQEELSHVRKADADAGVAYVQNGVISPEEERKRLSRDPASGYDDIDPDDVPEHPDAALAEINNEAQQGLQDSKPPPAKAAA